MAKTTWFKSLAATAIIALGAAVGMSITAQAQTEKPIVAKANTQTTSVSTTEAAIAAAFELKFENSQVKSVQKTPFNDLYEVILQNNQIAYTNAATEFVMLGDLINSTDMSNLTQARTEELSVIDFKSLPLKQAFILVKGNGKRHIAIFEDPNCGYCKLFRKTLEKVDNITVHTFAIDILGPSSTAMSQKLLCAKDPAHAWDSWMLHGTQPTAQAGCDATEQLAKNKALAVKLGVTGTPSIYFENGKHAPGAVEEAAFNALLIKNSAP